MLLPAAEAPEIRMPVVPFPEMTLPAPALVPPMRLSGAPWIRMPPCLLLTTVLPLAPMPMKLP